MKLLQSVFLCSLQTSILTWKLERCWCPWVSSSWRSFQWSPRSFLPASALWYYRYCPHPWCSRQKAGWREWEWCFQWTRSSITGIYPWSSRDRGLDTELLPGHRSGRSISCSKCSLSKHRPSHTISWISERHTASMRSESSSCPCRRT